MVSRNDLDRRLKKEKLLRDKLARAIVPGVRPDLAADFIVEHLATSEYKSTIDDTSSTQEDHIFEDNARLWRALMNDTIQANTIIKLRNFTITEWVPRSPGTFHTAEAIRARDEAWHYRLPEEEFLFRMSRYAPLSNAPMLDWETNIARRANIVGSSSFKVPIVFAPQGKLSMIQGGIGCVRLLPLELRRENFWLLGATSSKIAHEGIPVAIRDDHYNKFAGDIVKGGLECDLTCRLRYIRSSGQLEYGRMVPRCYLEIETINLSQTGLKRFRRFGLNARSKSPSCLVCVAVSFETDSGGVQATYASFESDSRDSFEQAIEWMDAEYVRGIYNGKILTDFDEKVSPFSDVLFCLKDIMNGRIVGEASRAVFSVNHGYYAERIALALEKARSITIERVETMNTKIIKVGPNSTVSAPITIADSIENSFNTIQSSTDNVELKSLLQNLLKSVAEIAPLVPEKVSKDLARDANDVVREATSEEPRSEVCLTLLDRVSKTTIALGSVAVPLSNCVTALLKFFSGTPG